MLPRVCSSLASKVDESSRQIDEGAELNESRSLGLYRRRSNDGRSTNGESFVVVDSYRKVLLA
jgi:hypothetical protein